jgi:hypothetical protein
MTLLGYTRNDIETMMDSVHMSKLYYLHHEGIQQNEESATVKGLLNTVDFFYGLLEEGYFDND